MDRAIQANNQKLKACLRKAAATGAWVDLGSEAVRTVPISVLRDLVTSTSGETLHSVKIKNAIIEGDLDLHCCTLTVPLCLEGCEIKGSVNLNEAKGVTLRFDACSASHFRAAQLFLTGDLWLLSSKIDGEVNLSGARLKGNLVLSGTEVDGGSGSAVLATGITVDKSVICRTKDKKKFKAKGVVSLTDGSIGGLHMSDAELFGDKGRALSADRLTVTGSVHGKNLKAQGQVKFVGADVRGQFTLSSSSIDHRGSRALNLDGITVARDLYLESDAAGLMSITGELSLVGAKIGGQLSFIGVVLEYPDGIALSADGVDVAQDLFCRASRDAPFKVQGEVSLTGAHVGGQIDLAGAILDSGGQDVALCANNITVGQVFFMQGEHDIPSSVAGEFRMLDGRIGGSLAFHDCTFVNKGMAALVAARTSVGGNLTLNRSNVDGLCRLAGTQVRGQLTTNGGELSNPDGIALDLEGVEIGQGMHLGIDSSSPTLIEGGVNLMGARIGSQLVMQAVEVASKGVAVAADRAEVEGDLFLSDSKFVGEVRLASMHVSGQLVVRDGLFENETGTALCGSSIRVDADCLITAAVKGGVEFDGAQVEGRFRSSTELEGTQIVFDLADAVAGSLEMTFAHGDVVVDLRRSSVGTLHRVGMDTGQSPPALLEGFTYQSLTPPDRGKDDVDARLRWITGDPDGYSSHPYEQLREIYRRTGFDFGARRVGIFSQKQRRCQLGFFAKLGNRFFGAVVGHGYRPSQALGWLIALLAVGWVLFGCVFTTGKAGSDADLTALKPAKQQVSLQPVAYTTDLLIPGIGLNQQGAWDAHGTSRLVGLALTAAGWLLTAAVLAGISVRRQ